jgi:uncharacterized protein (DUF302 family)
MDGNRVKEIRERIAELKARWPAHSVPPRMFQQLEELEDELEEVKADGMKYGYKKQVALSYDDAVAKARDELAREGFGVLTEIDVQATLKKKLNVDFDRYIILGACNPPFAYEALREERDIGLMMPCNVIVYEDRGKTYVSATLPTVTMAVVQNEKLAGTAGQVEARLKKVVDSI